MTEIKKKVLSEYFNKILTGEKKTELRLADFDIKSGDTLTLIELDDITKHPTDRTVSTAVTYVMKTKDCTYWSDEEINRYGYQVIQFDLKNKE